jgi:hypothetical protein
MAMSQARKQPTAEAVRTENLRFLRRLQQTALRNLTGSGRRSGRRRKAE